MQGRNNILDETVLWFHSSRGKSEINSLTLFRVDLVSKEETEYSGNEKAAGNFLKT